MVTLNRQSGFALPSVMIAATVMLIVLMSTLATITSIRAGIDRQYYEQIAREAAEAGTKRVTDCFLKGTYSSTATIRPDTDCYGVTVSGYSATIISNTQYTTSYTAQFVQPTPYTRSVTSVGIVSQLRKSGGAASSYQYQGRQNFAFVQDATKDRATKRFWYFGRSAKLDFGASGSAAPVYSLPSPATPTSQEGTTVVTDQSGNLQFWSDGLKIWDKNNAAMLGSTGLLGSGSATQAAAAFPLNTERTLYGVVSNSGQGETGLGELYLHIIDMTRNGGLGEVVSKNQMLGVGKALGTATTANGNNADKSYAAEGLGAMPKSDGSGYFVYTFSTTSSGTGKLIGFLIRTNGQIDPTPIVWTMSPAPTVCQVGAFSPNTAPNNTNAPSTGYGTFNFTKDYTKMLMSVGAWSCPSTTSGRVYYLSMDPATGAPTLIASWLVASSAATSTHGLYSVDFSPGEGYVYTSQIYPTEVQRYSLANLTNVAASRWVIGPASARNDPTNGYIYGGGAISRGPDNRMYVADVTAAYYNAAPCRMVSISTPDAATNTTAAIGWNLTGVTLNTSSTSTGCSTSGLPQTATSYQPSYYTY